jgi:hypothetical protein
MTFKAFYLSIVLLINSNHFVNSHSWVSCTDYKVNNNQPINYDINKCSGFPRDFESQYNSDLTKGFGYDTGYEFRSQGCRNPKNSNYNLKIANYVSGQEVCLIYPSKNHVAEYCTNNPFIPDNGLFISRSAQSNSDNFDINYEHKNGQHQFGTVDYKGFQNCPGFCQNNDKTPCYVCFNLENNIPSGIYSFKWTWELNPGEYYTTCWDAQINGPNSPPNSPSVSPPSVSPTNSPPSNSPTNSPPSNSPTNSPPTNSPPNNQVDDHHDNELYNEEDLNKNNNHNNNDDFSDENLINNNPFKSMEEQCKSDDNVCKDNVNKRRDAYNKMLDRKINPNNNQNNNQNNNNQNNNQNNNNQNNNNQNNNQNNNNQNNNPNLRTEVPKNEVSLNNNPLKYEYVENNICKL